MVRSGGVRCDRSRAAVRRQLGQVEGRHAPTPGGAALLGEPYRASYRKGVITPYAPGTSKLDSEREALLLGLSGGEPNWSEQWQYGRFSLSDMPDLASRSDKAFVVWFDDWGRVMGFRKPTKGPFAAASQPGRMQP